MAARRGQRHHVIGRVVSASADFRCSRPSSRCFSSATATTPRAGLSARMAGWTALTFCLWSVATIWWVWNAAPIGVFAATAVQVVLFGAVFMFYHYTSKRSRPALANVLLVCGWIAAEYIYLNGQISFPWLLLGNGFANDTWAIQWYEFTGALGGSLWVLVSNLLIFRALTSRRKVWWLRETAWAALPVLLSLVLFWSWKEPAGERVTVTAIQPNIEPPIPKSSDAPAAGTGLHYPGPRSLLASRCRFHHRPRNGRGRQHPGEPHRQAPPRWPDTSHSSGTSGPKRSSLPERRR